MSQHCYTIFLFFLALIKKLALKILSFHKVLESAMLTHNFLTAMFKISYASFIR